MIVSNFAIAYSWELRNFGFSKYGLQITNLEEQEIEFAVECHVGSQEGQGLATSYLNDAVGINLNLTGGLESFEKAYYFPSFRSRGNVRVAQVFVRIGAKCSARYELFKRWRPGGSDDVEIRGFIVLRVLPVSALAQRYFRQPQTDHAVKVLLHARRQDTRDYYAQRSESSSEAIAISSGRAENDLEPEETSGLTAGIIRDLHTRWTAGQLEADELVGARDLEEKDQAAKLVDLLLALRGGTDDLEALNQLLATCDAEVRVGQVPSSAGPRNPK